MRLRAVALRRSVSRTSFFASRLILHSIPDAPPPCSNAPVGDFDQPVTEQIRARFETVRPESTEGRVTSFEHGSEGVHHGKIPGFGGVKKTTIFLTAARKFDRV